MATIDAPARRLRENTERPITVDQGTNTIVGTDPAKIRRAFDDVIATGGKAGRVPEYWDEFFTKEEAKRAKLKHFRNCF